MEVKVAITLPTSQLNAFCSQRFRYIIISLKYDFDIHLYTRVIQRLTLWFFLEYLKTKHKFFCMTKIQGIIKFNENTKIKASKSENRLLHLSLGVFRLCAGNDRLDVLPIGDINIGICGILCCWSWFHSMDDNSRTVLPRSTSQCDGNSCIGELER